MGFNLIRKTKIKRKRASLPIAALALCIAIFSGCALSSQSDLGLQGGGSQYGAASERSAATAGQNGVVQNGTGAYAATPNIPSEVPDYAGEPYVDLEKGVPDFTQEELDLPAFESYAPLDSLGRSVCAFAMVGDETRPANNESRGSISYIKPSGWDQGFYDFINGESLYNRSHLIAWSLSAENDNPCNLMTGTTYMNQDVMQRFENRILAYIRNTGNHVLVRSTPVFEGSDLLARGVHYEARSIEDGGEAICINVFLFNVQPGVQIDYATGANWAS